MGYLACFITTLVGIYLIVSPIVDNAPKFDKVLHIIIGGLIIAVGWGIVVKQEVDRRRELKGLKDD